MLLPYFKNLFIETFLEDAGDLFLREGKYPRVRKSGKILTTTGEITTREMMENLWQQCGADPVSDYERDLRLEIDERHFRINVYRCMDELAAAIRPIKSKIPTLEHLGLPASLLRSWISRPTGIILVTGPTGAGKSTTLASCLSDLNSRDAKHVVTIEDPIEYIFENDQGFFSQREIGNDTKNFSSALRASLRQNPDIIFVGEIRDEETAEIALRAAETGHLVLSTLHSSGVIETMERITNLFPISRRQNCLRLLAAQLVGVISQQLLPRKGGGLQLAVEHVENEGAMRKWITEGAHEDMAEFLRREDNFKNMNMLAGLINERKTRYYRLLKNGL